MHIEGEVEIDKMILSEHDSALADAGSDFLPHKPACHTWHLVCPRLLDFHVCTQSTVER